MREKSEVAVRRGNQEMFCNVDGKKTMSQQAEQGAIAYICRIGHGSDASPGGGSAGVSTRQDDESFNVKARNLLGMSIGASERRITL